MIMSTYNVYKRKDKIIELSVEGQKEAILNKVYSLDNSFYLAFYELVTEFAVIDAYEFFIEMDCHSNIFASSVDIMDVQRGKRFFKILAMYHTIKILRKKRNELNPGEMCKSLFFVYEFDKEEERLFWLLYTCSVRFESQFPVLFAKTLAKYLFSIEIENAFTLAFIENFCYNSYNSLLSYLSKYISINRRIKLAETQIKKHA